MIPPVWASKMTTPPPPLPDVAGYRGDLKDNPALPNTVAPADAQLITSAAKSDPVIAAIARALGLKA